MFEFSQAAVRGIVACIGTPSEKACDFLDFILNPGMRQLRSYLKGTKDFLIWIEKLKEQYPELPPLFSFLTIDYDAMYPNMKDSLAMPAVKEYLDNRLIQRPSTEMVLKLLNAIKKSNKFELGNRLFQQTTGTSIGMKQAPPYACLGAGKLEEEKIMPAEVFQELVLDNTENDDPTDRWFRRFIDELFLIFLGNEQKAKEFVDWLNGLEEGISFTFEWSDKQINYLDVELIVEDGKVKTNLHIKPTNPQLYLRYESNHPPHVLKAIPYGQAIRIKTICSEPEFLEENLMKLKEKLISRGYPVTLINEQFRKVENIERADLLKVKTYPHGATPQPISQKPIFTQISSSLSIHTIPHSKNGSSNTITSS